MLPGTGGLTRVTDKRKVRRDLADIFCTSSEGVRGQRAKDWKLVDDIYKTSEFAGKVQARALELAAKSDRPSVADGIALPRVERRETPDSIDYRYVGVKIDRHRRVAELTVRGPDAAQPTDIAGILAVGAGWWPLQMARELDDAILTLRANELDIGVWLLRTQGDAAHVLEVDAALARHAAHWFVRETIGMLRRTFARLDVSSRSLFALIEQGSCFAGPLVEIALAADRSYMASNPDDLDAQPSITLTAANFDAYPSVAGISRLAQRFYEDAEEIAAIRTVINTPLDPARALALGLVTAIPDDIDWTDEIRLAIEERVSQSPDALTGLEANLRFGNHETMETRIFGRLTAWQNWIFIRPNAVGEKGALKVYGKGEKAAFDFSRV